MRDDKGIIGLLLGYVQREDSLTKWDTYLAILLLFCAAYLAGTFWRGLNGQSCSTSFLADPPFGASRRMGCLVRGFMEILPDRPTSNLVKP